MAILIHRQHGHSPHVHHNLRLPPVVIFPLAGAAHGLHQTLLVLEVHLQQVELLLQLVNREAGLCPWVRGLRGFNPLGQLVNLPFQLGPTANQLIEGLNPFPKII